MTLNQSMKVAILGFILATFAATAGATPSVPNVPCLNDDVPADWPVLTDLSKGFCLSYPPLYQPTLTATGDRQTLNPDSVVLHDKTSPDADIIVTSSKQIFDLENLTNYAPTGVDTPPQPIEIGGQTFYFYGAGGGGVCYADQYFFDLRGHTLSITFSGPCVDDKTPSAAMKKIEHLMLASFRSLRADTPASSAGKSGLNTTGGIGRPLATATPQSSSASSLVRPLIIAAEGHGETQVKPDTVHIIWSVRAAGSSAAEAEKANSAISESIIKSLKTGFPGEFRSEMSSISVSEPPPDRTWNSSETSVWKASGYVKVQVSEGEYAKLMDVVVAPHWPWLFINGTTHNLHRNGEKTNEVMMTVTSQGGSAEDASALNEKLRKELVNIIRSNAGPDVQITEALVATFAAADDRNRFVVIQIIHLHCDQ